MFVVSMETLKSARRHARPRAYLARLMPGIRDSIDRRFVRPVKINANRQMFSAAAQPGDVFEARRWLWDMHRQQYFGGTVWFGVQASGKLTRLTRDEAFRAVHSVRVGDGADHGKSLIVTLAERMMPDDIVCLPQPMKAIECRS